MECKKLRELIEKYNSYFHVYTDESADFFNTFDLELAKAFMLDFPDSSIRVAKIILAMKDIGEIKVKIE